MSIATDYGSAALAVARRDVLIFRTYRLRFLGQVLAGFFTVAMTYYVSRLVSVRAFHTPDEYFAFAVVGIVIMQVIFSIVGALPAQVRQELVAGTFEKCVVSPFGAAAAVVSMTTFPILLALATGATTLAWAALVFGMPMHWSTVPLAVPAALLGCLSFIPFALLGTAAVILVKQAQSGVGFLTTGIAFIAGLFFPVALLPAWIRWASDIQPFSPAVDLLRNVLVGTPLHDPLSTLLIKMGLAAVVLAPISIWVLSLAIRRSQRLGTIIEY